MPASTSPTPRRRAAVGLPALALLLAATLPLLLGARQPGAVATAPDPAGADLRAEQAAGAAAGRSQRTAPVPVATSVTLDPTAEGARASDDDLIAVQAVRDVQQAPELGELPTAPPRVPLADARDVALVVPASDPSEAIIGFHQSGHGSAAVPLDPAGDDAQVMASRGRGTSATSAVDVAMPPGDIVVSPVSGTVVTAAAYSLYGRTKDFMVTIAPHDDPDLEVHLYHLERLEVEEGEEVLAGRTALGEVRVLPFGSQIDRLTGDDRPHVHVEVRRS